MAELLLETIELTYHIGGRPLLDRQSLQVWTGDRIGLIGENGAGKTTLLRLLSGELHPDSGQVRALAPLALIHQLGDTAQEIGGQLSSLFHAPAERPCLSGGELTRRRIAAALAAHPRLLLADEPTTDLDAPGQALLTAQLAAWSGALLLVSHDRALLRRLCGRIWYLENGHITDFPGGLDAFEAERRRQRERARFEYDQYRREQARLQEAARRMAEQAASVRKAPSRMGNSEARLHKREATDAVLRLSHARRTMLNRAEQLEAKERPRDLPDIRMALGVAHPVRAKSILSVQVRQLEAGGVTLLRDTALQLPTGSRTALVGANGCGKTSLLSVLAGHSTQGIRFSGEIRLNPEARPGWFDQHHERTLDPARTLLENVSERSSQPPHMARTVLTRLGFSREAAMSPVGRLSGGETAKAALARLMLMDCNLLLLDEPTNHLDLFTLAALEELLAAYGGTLLFVSHDQELIRKVATRVIRFEGQRLITGESGPDEPPRPARSEAELQLEITRLEMRLAALSARMAAPRKGDRPEALSAEYDQTAQALREARGQGGDRR